MGLGPASRPFFVPCSIPSLRQRSEEHTSELQSRLHLVCRLLLEKKKINRFPSLALLVLLITSPASLSFFVGCIAVVVFSVDGSSASGLVSARTAILMIDRLSHSR